METQVCKCCGRELPIEQFSKNPFWYIKVCRECNSKNRREGALQRGKIKQQAIDALNARKLRLSDFTPRELMEELKRRGYEGKLRYVKVEEIDLNNI